MKSIQSRLLLMLLMFIILPYFLSVFLIYSYTKNSVEQHEIENSREQLKESSDELEQYFSEMVRLPYTLYRDPELFKIFTGEKVNSAYLENSMEKYFLMRSEIRQVRLYLKKSSESVAVYNGMVSARKSKPGFMEQEDDLQQLYHSNDMFMVEAPHEMENYNNSAIVPTSDHLMVLTIHHKIIDVPSNEFLGILTTDIDLDAYAQIIDELVNQNEETVLLTNEKNQIVYANDKELIGQPIPSFIQKQVDGGNAQSADDDIVLSKPLSGPLEDWKLVKMTPSEVLFEDIRKTTFTSILLGMVVGILGVIMISMITYKITSPIKRLTQKVRTVEGGDMNVPFDESRNDEIGYLEKQMKEMIDRINTHIDREYKLEIENKENQFRALKSQVNPHFLFNALQSIGAVALRSKAPDIYQLVTSLSKMMRYSMNADQWVSLQEEVDYIEAYLILQKERFRNHIHYSIDISETIKQKIIPSMILQPLVENFFKHSYEEGYRNAHLTIRGEIKGDYLHLTAANDGASITDQELNELRKRLYAAPGSSPKKHIGLKNIHDRLILNFGRNARLSVDHIQRKGFLVKIIIPIETRPGLKGGIS
ncbi:cache domain-containing sensor histidine kinase [Halobacillus massiliensis]|uniref:cache domain-containing sensor histidine kinase n=1 Tax=Halobacillus massiliensis TaxID=1926286 RepID=UPI0009E216F8|nr:sensor histidine kinase [Halobacillus massiliensis]